MTNLFLNTAINSEDSSPLETFANTCLSPVRYLYQGRTIEIVDKKIVSEKQSYVEQDWKKTALAIALLVPGLLLGLVAKLLSYCFSSARMNYQITRDFINNPLALPTLAVDDIMPLYDFIKKREAHLDLIMKKMTSVDAWTNPDFLNEFTEEMEVAYREMLLYYRQLIERHGDNPEIMAKVMIRQNFFGADGAEAMKKDPTIYCYPYFRFSVTDLYHLARSHAYLTPSDREEGSTAVKTAEPLTDEIQKPYFNPQAQQYYWRLLYNSFCSKLDEYELRDKIKDPRFVNWSKPDLGFVDYFSYPDTKPT